MKKVFSILFLLFLLLPLLAEEIVTLKDGKQIVVYDDYTWGYISTSGRAADYSSIQDNQPPEFLRQGVQATRDEIIAAIQMYEQGWRYTMPRPKSGQAAWGNGDGRTTWYNGWWRNEQTGQYSSTTPKKGQSGQYLGDNQNNANTWRNGGTPGRPDVYMYLLSKSGGPR